MTRSRQIVLVALGLGAVVAVVTRGGLLFPAPFAAKAIGDTLRGVTSIATAALFVYRFRQSRRGFDAGLALGFALLGVSALSLALGRGADAATGRAIVSLALAGRVVATTTIVLIACEVVARVRRSGRAATVVAWAVIVAGALVAIVPLLVSNEMHELVTGDSAGVPIYALDEVPWVSVVLHAGLAAMLAVGAWQLHRKGRLDGDTLAGRFGMGLALLAGARCYIVLFPALQSGWFHVGDVLGFAAHIVLLWAATAAVGEDWQQAAGQRALHERQAIAGELHDGLAQELALLTAKSRSMASKSTEAQDLEFVSEVALRALNESRRTTARLRGLTPPPSRT